MNKVRGFLFAALVSAALFGLDGRPAAAANMVVNGSFEDPALGFNSWASAETFPVGSSPLAPGSRSKITSRD